MKAWLDLLRISNLPTVWTNTLVGAFLANAGWGLGLVFALFSVSGLYLGGMALNDAFDAERDRRLKTDRPIARGELRQTTVMIAGFALLAMGIAGGGLAGALIPAVGVTAAVVMYNVWHHRLGVGAASVPLMGVCRAGAYLIGAGWPIEGWSIVWVAALVGLYITHLTFLARVEDTKGRLGRIAVWSLVIWPIVATAMFASSSAAGVLIGLVAVGMTALGCFRINGSPAYARRAIMDWLLVVSLIDAAVLFSAGWTSAAWAALGCFALARIAQRFIMGS